MYYRIAPHISTRLIDKKNAKIYNPDLKIIKYLNETGLYIWSLLDGEKTEKDINEILKNEYQTSAQVIEDIREFLNILKQQHFVEENEHPFIKQIATAVFPHINDAPNSLDISVTRKCNLRCKYCFYDDEMQERNDVSLDEWGQFFREIGELGVEDLTLSGGEFFVRNDWLEIIDLAIDNQMRFSILSNGTLIDKETINLFNQHNRKRRLDYIQISIDGSCAKVHDKSRGKGSFEKAVRGLRLLKENGFPVTVRVTINKYNVDDLENIAHFLLNEIKLNSFGTNDAMPMGAGCFNQEDIVLSPHQQYQAILKIGELEEKYPGRILAQAGPLAKWHGYREMEESLKQEKQLNPRMGFLTACGCIYHKLSVHHDGVITPCNMLADLELGKINQDKIKDIWNKHPTLIMMKQRRKIPMSEVPGCEDCKWQQYCNGSCPGLAYELTGEVNQANPHDCYRKFIEQVGHGIET